MANVSTVYALALVLLNYIMQVHGTGCPVVECWFVQEKPGRGFPAAMSQEKSLMYVRTDPDSTGAESQQKPPADIDPTRIYHVTDSSASLCSSSLKSPEGSVKKPLCEINPFLPQPAVVKWAAPLTSSAQSPIYLQADWFSASLQGLDGQLTLSSVMRAPKGTNEPNVILSVFSTSTSIRSRLGVPVVLDCGFWMDASSPLSGLGFAVEWRYQFRGEGRLVVAYDGKGDRLAETTEEGAELDIPALHQTGNASLLLEEAQVRHTGTYICTAYLPYLLAQVAIDLEIEEPPSLSISPSPLPISYPGQTLSVQCEASGFAPLSLELSWEFVGADGGVQSLGEGGMSGHRQASDGTFSQSSRLTLDLGKLDLGRGGEVTCVAVHPGGTRRASTTLNIIGVSGPSIEDSMAMVAVALGLYGVIKLFSWMFGTSGPSDSDSKDKKDK
ncbi:tapasin-like [Megalops cyprinoides]|uniref:tapasin-like n=1 Tax=Megalops cyprinoides TaxID=118141 RepID=UPI001865080F|nr:tapasin-like [Megalops cyprinoides]